MTRDLVFTREGVRLTARDYGGEGAVVLLLHGLAGHAGEWAQTADWLSEGRRVVALDARGHGGSERRPADVSRAAHVADVAFAVERLEHGPVVLVGHSLGGHTALLVAARNPELVRGLVVAEASPNGGDEDGVEAAVDRIRTWLAAWPVPFGSREEAVAHFGGPSVRADAWASGLEERDGCWWPRFDVDVMLRTLREAVSRPYWDEWERIACPTLVVRASDGIVTAEDAQIMLDRLPVATVAEIGGAGHDVHLDRPAEWREALSGFLTSFPSDRPA